MCSLQNRGVASRAAVVLALAVGLSACATQKAEELPPAPVMAPPPPPAAATLPPPPIYRVRSGSPAVLERFPRGSVVSKATKICLKEGEQINIIGNNGQSVTYKGPGCMERTKRPTPQNQGGFTFGYWRPDGDGRAERAK